MDPVHSFVDSDAEPNHWDADSSEQAARAPGPGSYGHQPAGQFHAADCSAEQRSVYVMFDGLIETGFPDD